MKKFSDNLIVKLVVGVAAGIAVGLAADARTIGIINTVKFILGQVISFMVPLIIVGFIAPAITQLRANASKMLGTMIVLAYTSTVLACIMSMFTGYALIPGLNIVTNPEGLRPIPDLIFKLEIPALFSVMSALVLSLLLGMAVIWTKAELVEKFLLEFNKIVLALVNRVVIPILPVFIACTFATLAYEGSITQQAPVFLKIIVIVMVLHYIWLAVLYTVAGIISRKSPWEVVKHYGPAYLTGGGTMSSAATPSLALDRASKSPRLRDEG
ncbi:MAG: dicarboxylate/amino acid:cation symporter, partial [Acidaminococcaceae bacterium]|nr:dicarboxylate/amino acid:cation symporter [Acidaminococcaceae bacterium]